MAVNTLLVIGLVWPEPTSSAAGWRMLQLLRLFQDLDYRVYFASAAQVTSRSQNLKELGIETLEIKLNDTSFDERVKTLNPRMVMFDRFITEEQYGWRVSEQVPDAIKILDAEDFHGLRKARQLALKEGVDCSTTHLQNDITKREIVAMYRCDLTLVISEAEMELFKSNFNFPESLLLYLPFLCNEKQKFNDFPPFLERKHFITVGNFLHAPNADAILYLKSNIWPLIKRSLPKAELHIYGAYQSHKAQQLHNEKQGFFIKGAVPDIKSEMRNYRLSLAPLRFGAGLKGKVFDAMATGTPAVMSTIASEGLFGNWPSSGEIADDAHQFAKSAVELYCNESLWVKHQQNGFKVLEHRFSTKYFREELKNTLEHIQSGLGKHRQDNFLGQLFQQQTVLASKYLSKWIEAKNQ